MTLTYQQYGTKYGKRITSISSAYPLFKQGVMCGALNITKDMNVFKSILETYRLKSKSGGTAKESFKLEYNFSDIIGEDQEIKKAIEMARKVARTSSPVLLFGETGTGKELWAQSIHKESELAGDFVPINCAAIPENLLEGMLFGTSKGAFTGSIDNVGLFEKASEGTLFLDELNSMELLLQSKLLRALETGKIRRIGESEERVVSPRLISALSISPREAIEGNTIRPELFYRLGVIVIRLPSLRERPGDIPLLVEKFLDNFNSSLLKNVKGVSSEVMELFFKYDWPGNVRELKHTVESAMHLVEDDEEEIRRTHLSTFFLNHSQPRAEKISHGWRNSVPGSEDGEKNLKDTLEKVEREMIIEKLEKNRGNVSAAAQDLGIKRQSLDYKIRKYGIGGK